MPFLIIVLAYLLGSIPTAYIAGRLLKGVDIREMGDGNMGAQNAFHVLGARTGITVGIIDAGKGALAILIAQAANIPQPAVLLAGATAVAGHNWPLFIGFRGGQGVSTTIGILLTVITQSMLIMALPALATLIIKRSVILASCVLFIPLPLVCWWLGVPGGLIAYGVGFLGLVAFTHYTRPRHRVVHPSPIPYKPAKGG